MTAMQLVLPGGRVVAGADAVPELLRRIRGLGLAGRAVRASGCATSGAPRLRLDRAEPHARVLHAHAQRPLITRAQDRRPGGGSRARENNFMVESSGLPEV